MQPEQTLDVSSYWSAIGSRAVGVAIVTTIGKRGPAGFLALSASHLTADPPTMTVSIGRRTAALEDIHQSGVFAINYLAADSASLHERFAARDAAKGAERFDGLKWAELSTGAPVFADDIVGALDCRMIDAMELYGTTLAVGRIVNQLTAAKRAPMIHFRGAILA